MPVTISRALADRLRALAAAEPDREICGLLLGSLARIEAAIACKNVAADPVRAFEIDPSALFAAIRDERGGGQRVAGYYHSHPSGDARPSASDLAQSAPDGRFWLIVAGEALALWRRDAGGFAPERLEIAPV